MIRYITIISLATFFFSCSNRSDRGDQEKPNVVILFIDDLGYGDLSRYGNKMVRTPNIDGLAEKGISYTNFYVNSPICSPSRVALITGQYPMRFKVHSYIAGSRQNEQRAMANYLDPSVSTIAKTLKAHGYHTGHFGKWHMGGGRDLGDVPLPTEYGYNESLVAFEGVGDRILFPDHELSKQSAELGRGEIKWVEKHQSTATYIDRALEFIEKAGDEPFFVNLCTNDVHDPHLPDPEKVAKWEEVTDNPYEQKFFAVLEELDLQIGRFLSELEKSGKLSNTIILFTGDNGPTDWPRYYNKKSYPEGYGGDLYAPGFTGGLNGRKWSLYEGGIREPFIFYWKDHSPVGQVDSTSVFSSIDLYPSICGLLGIEQPKELDGTDKKEIFLGTPTQDAPAIMWEYASNPGGSIGPGNPDFKSPNLAIREGKWKLLINVDGSQAQLFDLEKDPGETTNLATEKPELVQELSGKVIAWRKSMPVELAVN